MTKDMYPEWWLRALKIYLKLEQLSKLESKQFLKLLPPAYQKRIEAIRLTIGNNPRRALKELEINFVNNGTKFLFDIVDGLPKQDLEILARAGVKKGKWTDNILKMKKEELRELVRLFSVPKELLVYITFHDRLDNKRRKELFK
jgi:hypothetical protein